MVIHFAEATFFEGRREDTNQLAPSAARPFWSLILPVITGASTTDIHSDESQAESSKASVRDGTPDTLVEQLTANAAAREATSKLMTFIVLFIL